MLIKLILHETNRQYGHNLAINKLLMDPDDHGGSRGSQKTEEQHHAMITSTLASLQSAVSVLLFIIVDFVVRGANCTGKAAVGLLFGRDV